jgi:hypothetical protein
VRNLDAKLAGAIDVNFHVAARINDRRYARFVVADDVGQLRQAFRIYLFKYQCHNFLLL